MQSRTSRVRWNSLFAFLSQLIRLVTTFLLFVGVARLYGVEAFGQFTTAHSLASMFLLFADFGFDMLLPTELARHRKDPAVFVQRFFSLKIVFAGLATAIMVALALTKDFTDTTRGLIFAFSPYVLFASLSTFFFALFKGFEEFEHETKISFSNNLVLLFLLIFLGGVLKAPLYAIALSFVATRALGIVSCLRVASNLTGVRVWRLNFEGWRETWGNVAVFGLHYIFGNLFFQIDTILLAFLRGDSDVGLYQSVFKISTFALIVPDIAVTTMMPVLARFHDDDRERWLLYGRLLQRTLFLIALPISMILFVYPEQVVGLLYGPAGFLEAVPILRIFAITVFVRFGVDAYALMLTTSRRQSRRMAIVMVGTLLNVALNLYMIPAYNIWGAAIVSLVTNIVVAGGYIVMARVSFREWSLHWRNVVPLFLFGLTSCILWNFQSVSIFVIVPIVLVFCVGIGYFIGYSKSERELLFNFKQTVATRKNRLR